jgi:hypothetical protein
MRAQEFVAEITMAMFDVDEVETDLARQPRSVVEIFDEITNVVVRKQP